MWVYQTGRGQCPFWAALRGERACSAARCDENWERLPPLELWPRGCI